MMICQSMSDPDHETDLANMNWLKFALESSENVSIETETIPHLRTAGSKAHAHEPELGRCLLLIQDIRPGRRSRALKVDGKAPNSSACEIQCILFPKMRVPLNHTF